LTLLLGSYSISCSFIAFPAWILLISLHIVIYNFRRSPQGDNNRLTLRSRRQF
jgi:hypothetical protein